MFELLLSGSSGRTISASGATGPFRAFPKSLSVDFGGLNHPQAQPLPQSLSQQQQQHQAGGLGQNVNATAGGGSSAQDRYAAVQQLDSVFSDTTTAAPGGKSSFTRKLFILVHTSMTSSFMSQKTREIEKYSHLRS